MTKLLIAFLALAIGASANANSTTGAQQNKVSSQTKSKNISIERFTGRSVVTNLGYNISLNKNSTLKREWFVLRDETAPLSIQGESGIDVVYKSGDSRSSGSYNYRAEYQLQPKEPISAFKVTIHVLDVFGNHIKTLASSEIEDFSDARTFDALWRIWSENEASEAFASVAYVSQVRTSNGRVYEIDRGAVLDQIRKVANKITEADLDPKREPNQK